MKKLKVFVTLLALIFGHAAMLAQRQYTMKGVVTEESGEPLIGATVQVKGSSVGVATDIDGNFAISVKNGDVLTVSYVGYSPQEVTVNGQNDITVVMKQDSKVLEDIVVIGYGTMKKKDLTGAISQIDPEKIADTNPGTVQDLLKSVPGLQVGYDASAKGGGSLQLRGQNSVYDKGGHNNPLLVVDGMIFYGELSEINPDDIQQIDVLKDASSTAVYGARAASGVIIITTKKGKQGKPVVSLSANWGINTKSAYTKYYNEQDYLRFRSDYFKSGTYGFDANGNYGAYNARDGKTGNLVVQPGYYDHYSVAGNYGLNEQSWAALGTNPEGASLDEIYFRRIYNMNGDVSQDLLDNYLAGTRTDWDDLTFRTGFNQDYNASMSGATDRVNYYLSFGFLRNEGVVKGNNYRAFRGNAKINGKVTNWLEIGANINFQDRTDGDLAVGLSENYWDADQLRNSYYSSPYKADGSLNQYPMGVHEKRGYNYLFDRQYYELDKGYTVLNTIFNAKVTLPFNITYQFNIAPRYQYFHDRYFMSADLPNSDPATRGVNREWKKTFDWTLNNTINWDYTFNEVHHVIATVVQEAEENRSWQDRIEARRILPSDALGFHNTSNATIADSKFSTNDTKFTADAWMGRLFYSYNDRYMITATVRRDGYCAFGKNHPHATFPSVALGWVFSDEKFFEKIADVMNYGKLRLSWGKNGNRSLEDPYISMANLGSGLGATMSYLDKNGNPVTELKYLMMDRLANNDLMWENTASYNFGLDFGFINNRLRGSVDVYHKETKNMLIYEKLPGFSGFGGIWTNIGQVNNDGVELSLTSTNIQNHNFTWETTFGFSYNKNTIKHINYAMEEVTDENGNVIGLREMNDTGNNWHIGKSIGTIWDYEFDGIWQVSEADEAAKYGQKPGDPRVVNHYTADDTVDKDGNVKHVYNEKDKVYLGNTIAPFFLNMRNEFKLWNNLSIAFSLYSKFGHKSKDGTYLNQGINSGNMFVYGFNRPDREYWTPENPTNDFARFNSQGPSGCTSPQRIINRNFLRLDNLSVGYTLPAKWTEKAGISKIRLSASIRNLFTIHSSDWTFDTDPENGGLATRVYNLGINMTF
jgi:tonB-linked outer membrane protein, susC/ragA family